MTLCSCHIMVTLTVMILGDTEHPVEPRECEHNCNVWLLSAESPWESAESHKCVFIEALEMGKGVDPRASSWDTTGGAGEKTSGKLTFSCQVLVLTCCGSVEHIAPSRTCCLLPSAPPGSPHLT